MVAGACLDGTDVKRELGCYFTLGDPFGSHPAVLRAIRNLPNAPRIVEPCAGMGHLAATFLTKVPSARFELFDLIPRAAEDCLCNLPVVARDSLTDFPMGYDMAVMNPPYLSRSSASRLGVPFPASRLSDLYEIALEGALRSAPQVLAVIPASFMVSGRFRERLEAVVELPQGLFGDTTHPVCLAIFGPDATEDYDTYIGHQRIGSAKSIAAFTRHPREMLNLRFNAPWGEIAFRGMDCASSRIGFSAGDTLDATAIKPTGKIVTRIALPEGAQFPVETLVQRANALVNHYRKATFDVGLCPFKDTRKRMTFTQAKAFLSLAHEQLAQEAQQVQAVPQHPCPSLRQHQPRHRVHTDTKRTRTPAVGGSRPERRSPQPPNPIPKNLAGGSRARGAGRRAARVGPGFSAFNGFSPPRRLLRRRVMPAEGASPPCRRIFGASGRTLLLEALLCVAQPARPAPRCLFGFG